MTTPNTLISLRITDEELALLDARVGLDGARNRSDVIRAAIRSFLEDQPLLPDMDTITIPVGRSMKSILETCMNYTALATNKQPHKVCKTMFVRLYKKKHH